MENGEHYPFVNEPLPYAYDALEPYIDRETVYVHHNRLLGAYTENLNRLLAGHPRLQTLTLPELILRVPSLSPTLQTPVRNNAGGVYNHRLYFDCLSPTPTPPGAALDALVLRYFGSYAALTEKLRVAALSVFGSGYAWLLLRRGVPVILTSPNQDTPLREGHPLLALDVWEHAYFLKHYNRRADYTDDFFRLLDWGAVARRFAATVN